MHSDAASIMGETLSNYIIPAAAGCRRTAEQRGKYAAEAVAEAQRNHRFGARCKVTARLRFSTIKHRELPAHFAHWQAAKWSRPLRCASGTAVHAAVLGGAPVVRYDGPGAAAWTISGIASWRNDPDSLTEYDTAKCAVNAIGTTASVLKSVRLGLSHQRTSHRMGLQRSPVPIDA